jgi:hypothetical protein
MISPRGVYILCDGDDCDAKVKNHRWGKTKAEGWFFSRDGKIAYCPEHEPAFLDDWRQRKKVSDD